MPVCQVTGAKSTTGNNVPNSNKKTKKVIKTSVKWRKYYSLVLESQISIKCTKRADDTITRHGGIDCFLLNSNNASLTGDMLKVKNTLLQSVKKKGLPSSPEEIYLLGVK